MVVQAVVAGEVGGFALSTMAQAIKGLYRVTETLDSFLDRHVDQLKQSDAPIIASTGRVLEAAKAGFGLGYTSAVTIMAVGQLLLGNNLAAVGVVASASVASNPIAMTCAAVGAIYYGWHALTDKEKNALLDRLQVGLTVGAELIRSIIEFVIRTMKALLDPDHLAAFKRYIEEQAALFGKSLSQVTGELGDRARELVDATATAGKDVAAGAAELLHGTVSAARDGAGRLRTSIADAAQSTAEGVKGIAGQLGSSLSSAIEREDPTVAADKQSSPER